MTGDEPFEASMWDRRSLLRGAGVVGTAPLAGCTSNPWGPGVEPEEEDSGTGSADGSGSETGDDRDGTDGEERESDGTDDEGDDTAAGDEGDDTAAGDEGADTDTGNEGGDNGSDSEHSDDDTGGESPDLVVEVAPDGFQFDPVAFEIEHGDTVRWVWRDNGHNVRVRSQPDGSDWTGTPGTGSDTYPEGYEHSHTFEVPGEYSYFCAPHQSLGLEGSFTVGEG